MKTLEGPATSPALVEGQRKWHRYVTVEPTMFLYMMAFMLTSVVEQAFFLHKACIVNHGFSEEVCAHLDGNDTLKKSVQVTVSNFHQWNNIASHVVPIVLALFLGAWSDKRGRKLPLLCGLVGKLVYSLMVVVNATQPTWPVEYIIYTASIPSAMTGADVAIFASAFAYISDVSSAENRTLRVTILDACYLSTMPIGVALGSYLFSHVFARSYVIMFSLNATLLLLSIVYTAVHLQWKTNERQRPISEVGCCGILPDFFDRRHVVASVKTMLRRRDTNRRAYLWILMVCMLFYTFQRDERPMTYLYTQFKFQWDTQLYSHFKTFQSTAYVIMMLGGIPLMSKWLGMRDTVITMIGCAAHIVGRLIFIVGDTDVWFYGGGAVATAGIVATPILKSMISKLVQADERGRVFVVFSMFNNAGTFSGGVIFAKVYMATVGTAWIFGLTAATQVVVLLLVLFIHISSGGVALDQLDAKKTPEVPHDAGEPMQLLQKSQAEK